MRRVDIRKKLANDAGFDEHLVVKDQDWHKTPRIQLQEVGWARSVHIDNALLKWQSQFIKGDVGSIGPYFSLENAPSCFGSVVLTGTSMISVEDNLVARCLVGTHGYLGNCLTTKLMSV